MKTRLMMIMAVAAIAATAGQPIERLELLDGEVLENARIRKIEDGKATIFHNAGVASIDPALLPSGKRYSGPIRHALAKDRVARRRRLWERRAAVSAELDERLESIQRESDNDAERYFAGDAADRIAPHGKRIDELSASLSEIDAQLDALKSEPEKKKASNPIASSVAYLRSEKDVRWIEVSGKNVYVGISPFPFDARMVARGAAWKCHRETGRSVNVWVTSSRAGWRPDRGGSHVMATYP